jgi:hypothetical protein
MSSMLLRVVEWLRSLFVTKPVQPSVPKENEYVIGRSTIFGLNYNGSIDKGDNGLGYFGYNTRDKSLIGVSLPIPVIDESIGSHKLASVMEEIKTGKYKVRVTHNNISIIAKIVDIGPAVWTHNAIDLTYGAVRALGIVDNSTVTYSILGPNGGFIPVKGWK